MLNTIAVNINSDLPVFPSIDSDTILQFEFEYFYGGDYYHL